MTGIVKEVTNFKYVEPSEFKIGRLYTRNGASVLRVDHNYALYITESGAVSITLVNTLKDQRIEMPLGTSILITT